MATYEQQQNCEHRSLSWKVVGGDGLTNTMGNGRMLDTTVMSSHGLRGTIEVKCNECNLSLRQPFGIPAAGVIGRMIQAVAANLRDLNGKQQVIIVSED